MLGANLLAGQMTARGGPREPMLIGLGLGAVGCLLLIFATPETAFFWMCGPFLLIGVGVGLVVPRKPAARLKDRPAANPNRRISPEDAYSRTGRRALEEAYPPSNLPKS